MTNNENIKTCDMCGVLFDITVRGKKQVEILERPDATDATKTKESREEKFYCDHCQTHVPYDREVIDCLGFLKRYRDNVEVYSDGTPIGYKPIGYKRKKNWW